MPVLENRIVRVGDAVNGRGWEHLEGEVGDLIATWSSIFEVFDDFDNNGYGDFRTGRKGGCVAVGEFVQPGTAV